MTDKTMMNLPAVNLLDHDHDKRCMLVALQAANVAWEADEVPVGAAIFKGDTFLAKGHNQVETLKDATAHAEIIAITAASAALGSKWLHGCTLYVTLEPCAMCAGAIGLARFDRIVYGAADPKTGACGSVLSVLNHAKSNHKLRVDGGVFAEECGQLLKEFFRRKREEIGNTAPPSASEASPG